MATQGGRVWYVDIEHPRALADPRRGPDFEQVRAERARVCAQASGLPCEAILFDEVSWELARAKQVRAIVISGNTTDWEEYDFDTFRPLADLVKSGEFPTLGLCGGHQWLGLVYGGRCDAIRRLGEDEPEQGGFAPGWYKEVGFLPVQVVRADPLFEGLAQPPVFFESHYWEIQDLPAEFDLLASSVEVRVQVIRHRRHLVYGTQFHPEVHSEAHPDGGRLMENFFRLAGLRS